MALDPSSMLRRVIEAPRLTGLDVIVLGSAAHVPLNELELELRAEAIHAALPLHERRMDAHAPCAVARAKPVTVSKWVGKW